MKYLLFLLLFATNANALLTPFNNSPIGVVTFNGRNGTVTSQASDYSSFYQSIRISNSTSINTTIPTLTGDYFLAVDTSGGSKITILPDASASGTSCVKIKNIGSPTNTNTIQTQFGQTIDFSPTYIQQIWSPMVSNEFCTNNNNWLITE